MSKTIRKKPLGNCDKPYKAQYYSRPAHLLKDSDGYLGWALEDVRGRKALRTVKKHLKKRARRIHKAFELE